MQQLVDRLRDPALAFRIIGGLALIVAWNSPAEQQFLWATEEAVGSPIDRIVRPVSETVYRAGIAHIQRHGWDLSAGLVLDRHGRQVEVTSVAQLVHGVDGVSYLGILHPGILRLPPYFPQFAENGENTTSGKPRTITEISRHVGVRTTYVTGARGVMPSDVTAMAVDYPKRIGRNVRLARDTADPALSQTQLAARLGVSRSELSDWERGRWAPRNETLERIADICGVPGAPDIGWFFDRHESDT